MNNPFILWGAAAGVFLALIYFFQRLARGKDRNIEEVVGVFGYAVGIMGGVQVCSVAYLERAAPPIENVSLQMFAGGFALVLFAVNKIVKKFQED